MKNFKKTVLFTIFALSAISIQAQSISPAHDRVLKQFKSGSEKTAKDVLWTSPKMFKVGVLNDGTGRDGYARYVCEVVTEAGLKGVSVQVIDIQKLVKSNKWEKLGEHFCG